tara:strand:+ start:21490 stop:21810 length:321 start_codon:yes stop_codon:yes gene_type:complete
MENIEKTTKYYKLESDFKEIDLKQFDLIMRFFFNNLPKKEDIISYEQELKTKKLTTKRINLTELDIENIEDTCDFLDISQQTLVNLALKNCSHLEILKLQNKKDKS